MKIVFVRHGHPDYKKDCLTDLGHLQAQNVANRILLENPKAIYSSICGRAVETAEHIAKSVGVPVIKLDFMHEISWGAVDGRTIAFNGHPWFTADYMVRNGQSVTNYDWYIKEPFSKNKVTADVRKAALEFDKWLKELGYEREGIYYRVSQSNPDTLILVSHAGSSSAVLAHLFNLPFPFICATVKPDFTAVTTVVLNGEVGELISPRFEILNDAKHLEGNGDKKESEFICS